MSSTNANTQQPKSVNSWMKKPDQIAGVHPGLEYLATADQIYAEQLVSLLEAFTGWEKNNKYIVRNGTGEQMYLMAEETSKWMRICCGGYRGFLFHVLDEYTKEVFRIERKFKCCSGYSWFADCCDHCAYKLKIETSNGNESGSELPLGFVKQLGSCWKLRLDIQDENQNSIYKVHGPCCIFDGPCCPCENSFKIMDSEGNLELGHIKKEYAGFVKEMFTLSDNYNVRFPNDSKPEAKASLLGAMILIDFMYFEYKDNDDK